MTLIIILCFVGGILLGILVILCVCLYCRRKKEIVNNNYEGVYHSVRYTATVRLYLTPFVHFIIRWHIFYSNMP